MLIDNQTPGRDGPPCGRGSVHVFGTVFLDLVFSELSAPPRPGTEVRAKGLGVSPGGTANVAVALARLGVGVQLSAAFGDDAFGHYLWGALEREGVDLACSRRIDGWTTPLTVSMAYGRDRSMVTYEEPSPWDPYAAAPEVQTADAFVVSLGNADRGWLERLRAAGGTVVADVGWDPAETWTLDLLDKLPLVDVFLPNLAEATAYSRQPDAARAAVALARHGPLVVVKLGASGALAAGGGLAEPVAVPALAVDALDTTGAGDVFDAGFVFGTVAGWPVARRLRFASLCAGESVRFAGGSFSAPCWRDLRAWWERQADPEGRASYAFLAELIEACPPGPTCRRPCASMAYPIEETPAGSPTGAERA